MDTREWTYFALGTAAPPRNWRVVAQDYAIGAMTSETANVNCLLVADTAAAAEVVVRCVRTSLAEMVRRLGVVRPRKRDLQGVTLRR